MKIGKGGAMARRRNYAQVVAPRPGLCHRSPQFWEQRLIHGQCFATVGSVSNPDHMNASIARPGGAAGSGVGRIIAA